MIKRELSGEQWCSRYPGDDTTATLRQPFRKRVQRFITSLEKAGAHVTITATWRPFERAALMRYSWDLHHRVLLPEQLPPIPGVPIEWVHPTLAESREAARDMVRGYRLVHRPSLTSLHIQGLAVDMTIVWGGCIEVVDGNGDSVMLRQEKGTMDNPDLWAVGASFGVHKLQSDPPHWSSTGG